MSAFDVELKDFGSGKLSESGALTITDAVLQGRLLTYRKRVAKRYKVVEPETIDRFLPEGELLITPKIDGQLWFLIKKDGVVALSSYNGRIMRDTLVVKEAEKLLQGVDELIVAGELFAMPMKKGGRPRVHHVNAALGDGSLEKSMGFKCFDILEEGEVDYAYEPYAKRHARLSELFEGGRRVAPVPMEKGDRAQLKVRFQDWVSSGKFEGLVAHSETGVTYKVKPTFSIDAVIVAYGETNRDGFPKLRELTVALLREDASFHILGTVGGGFSEEQRVEWLERLKTIETASSYLMANREGTLCHFVRPEIIVEVRISDLMDTDGAERPMRRMVLRYEEQGWRAMGSMPIPSMIFPRFIRERDDKPVDIAAIGLDQIYRHMPFEALHEEVKAQDLPEAEIIEREVYVKTTKGKRALRKFVALATHKHEVDPSFAPFVVFFTDFSAGRKDPLKTDMRVAQTAEGLQQHIEAWRKKNVKKGWELTP